jgi:hypothetical protein
MGQPYIPFVEPCVQADDGLATLDLSKSNGVRYEAHRATRVEKERTEDLGFVYG